MQDQAPECMKLKSQAGKAAWQPATSRSGAHLRYLPGAQHTPSLSLSSLFWLPLLPAADSENARMFSFFQHVVSSVVKYGITNFFFLKGWNN
jgi:hypothetical protein